MQITAETRFKNPFLVTAIKVGSVLDPTTGKQKLGEVAHAKVETVQDLIEVATASKLRHILVVPDMAVQALVLAAEWTGNLVNDPVEETNTDAEPDKVLKLGGE